MLIDTVTVTGKARPFCPACEEKINTKTKQAMEKRGKRVKNKAVIFPSVR